MQKQAGAGLGASGADLQTILKALQKKRQGLTLMDKKVVIYPGDYRSNVIAGHVKMKDEPGYPSISVDLTLGEDIGVTDALMRELKQEFEGRFHAKAQGEDEVEELGRTLDSLEAFISEFLESARAAIEKYPEMVAEKVGDSL
jgi:hypothetical protein